MGQRRPAPTDTRAFFGLSLRDLAHARDLYHSHLLAHANVTGTALGLYLIRKSEEWPHDHHQAKKDLSLVPRQKPKRTLTNSEVRSYSWPCVLVLVNEWVDFDAFKAGDASPDMLLPKQLWLPDGRAVPVCVAEAAPVPDVRHPIASLHFPAHLVGPGYPVLSTAQQLAKAGTLGPMVTDGRTVYAMTSRHVLGPVGSDATTYTRGEALDLGVVAAEGLTRLPVSEAYSEYPASNAFLNIDVGLIEVTDIHDWTTAAFGLGPIGEVVSTGANALSLSMAGQPVIAHGAVSGRIDGVVKGLLYRYKSVGGFEYMTDYLIGPAEEATERFTQPGDSGTMWYLAPSQPAPDEPTPEIRPRPQPLAIQWGGEPFAEGGTAAPYALASSLTTVCRLLDLDVIQDSGAPLFRYWGAVGHYGIALRAIEVLPGGDLQALMANNRDNITFPQDAITDKNLSGLSLRFVPLADVPDLMWKIGHHERGLRGANPESPNHFADMDQPDSDGHTLLDLCAHKATGLDPAVWLAYANDPAVRPPGQTRFGPGLLPFRVWQIFDAIVAFAKAGDLLSFLCSAGVLSHYVGDACQPLHISAWHDGDPNETEPETYKDHGVTKTRDVAKGKGVHAAYEDGMVNTHVADIFAGLQSIPKARARVIDDGRDAAWATIELMKATINTLPPQDIVARYLDVRSGTPTEESAALWESFGTQTIAVMSGGVRLLASLWLSAWKAAGIGVVEPAELAVRTPEDIEGIVQPATFLPSHTLDEIGAVLQGVV